MAFSVAGLNYNIDDGVLEAQVHGFRAGLLKQTDYFNLSQCDSLEGKQVYGICDVYIHACIRMEVWSHDGSPKKCETNF